MVSPWPPAFRSAFLPLRTCLLEGVVRKPRLCRRYGPRVSNVARVCSGLGPVPGSSLARHDFHWREAARGPNFGRGRCLPRRYRGAGGGSLDFVDSGGEAFPSRR